MPNHRLPRNPLLVSLLVTSLLLTACGGDGNDNTAIAAILIGPVIRAA